VAEDCDQQERSNIGVAIAPAAKNPKGLPFVAKWKQAFSTDDGKTWKPIWYSEFIHDDNCTPTP